GGEFSAHDHVTVLLDCIQICDASRDFMLRDSSRHRLTCEACAEICDACATSCAAFKGDDQLERCQAECHRCSESCRPVTTRRDRDRSALVRESLSRFQGSRCFGPCRHPPQIRRGACRVWPQSFVARRSRGPPNVAEIPTP